jgi:hypothetical protein
MISERLSAHNSILQKELADLHHLNSQRKERQSGKHLVLKGKVVVSTDEIRKALENAERITKDRKQKKAAMQRRKTALSNDVEDVEDVSDDENSIPECELLDCIEVASR